ncbi:MAG: hypothetical protein JWP25_7526 [Bradyrhizobium sp.]|jgi:hypothetical protein|nr:hypothetical protein [Bradyrhizobium sp.]
MSALNYIAGIATIVLDFLEKYNGAVTAVATISSQLSRSYWRGLPESKHD